MKTLGEKIEVMQAAERGEEIEFRASGGETWRKCASLVWNWQLLDYRVKPKAREVWVSEYGDSYGGLYHSPQAAQINARKGLTAIIYFVEAERIPVSQEGR